MKNFLVIVLFIIPLFACEDRYRYPCQNPDNYGSHECTPPTCVADGTCTEYLVRQPK